MPNDPFDRKGDPRLAGLDASNAWMHPGDVNAAFNDEKGKNAKKNQEEYQKAAHPNSSGPNGSSQWTKGADGTWQFNQSFNGPLAGANDSLMNQAGANFSKPFDTGNDARTQAINASYGQATSRLNPQWQQNEEQLGTQLANQGLDPNSQAYRTAMQQQSMQKNDAYSSAMNSAITNGNQAQALTFNQNMQAQNAPLQQLLAMQGLLPNAAGGQGLQALQGANNYNQQQQGQQADAIAGGAQAIGGIASAISDARMKENIQYLPAEATPGVPLAAFSYRGDPQRKKYVGVIAQDLERVAPEHVEEDENGIKHVSAPFAPFAFK